MTKQEMINVRDNTFHVIEKCCGTCKHLNIGAYNCIAIYVRGNLINKQVPSYGLCDLWEKREQK